MPIAARVKANDFPTPRITDRRIDEFIGICRGMADAAILTVKDVRQLDRWLARAPDLADEPLVAEIVDAVADVFADQFSDASRAELLRLVQSFVGGPNIDSSASTTLAFDDPPPPLAFSGMRYCLSGTFRYGTRNECTLAVVQRGGEVKPIAASTDVLVIGSLATDSWKHSSYGNKVASAGKWRQQSHPIVIVSEDHWVRELNRVPPLSPSAAGGGDQSASAGARPPSKAKTSQDEWDDTQDEVHRTRTAYYNGEMTEYEYQQRLAQLVPEMRVHRIGQRSITQAQLAATMPPPDQAQSSSDAVYQLGRSFAATTKWLARVPWYAWPILLFLLSFWYFSARIGR